MDPLQNHTSLASMLSSTKVDPLPVPPKTSGFKATAVVTLGAVGMLGGVLGLSKALDARQRQQRTLIEQRKSDEPGRG